METELSSTATVQNPSGRAMPKEDCKCTVEHWIWKAYWLPPNRLKDGRGDRIRTRGLRFWRPLLYQLSYTPALVRKFYPG